MTLAEKVAAEAAKKNSQLKTPVADVKVVQSESLKANADTGAIK